MKYSVLILMFLVLILSTALADNTLENNIVRSNIVEVDTYLNAGRVYLNVQTTGEVTCKQVITTLGIKPFTIKSRIYQPVCTRISGTLIRITYAEQVST